MTKCVLLGWTITLSKKTVVWFYHIYISNNQCFEDHVRTSQTLFTPSSNDYFIPHTSSNKTKQMSRRLLWAKMDQNKWIKWWQKTVNTKLLKVKTVLPNDGVLAGLVFGFSFHADDLNTAGVEWSGNAHLHKNTSYTRTEILSSNNHKTLLNIVTSTSPLSSVPTATAWS